MKIITSISSVNMNPLLFVFLAAVASAVPLERRELDTILDPLAIHGFQTIETIPTAEITKDKEIKPIVLDTVWDPLLRSQLLVQGSGVLGIPNIGLSGSAIIRPPLLGSEINPGLGIQGNVLGAPFFPQISLVAGAGAIIDRPRPIEDGQKKEEKPILANPIREEPIEIKSTITKDKDLTLVTVAHGPQLLSPIVHGGFPYYNTIPTSLGGDIIRPFAAPYLSDFILTSPDGRPLNKTIDGLPIREEFKPISGIHQPLLLV